MYILKYSYISNVTLLNVLLIHHYIQIRSITTNHDVHGTIANLFNRILHCNHHNLCTEEEIEMVRNIWFSQHTILRYHVRKTIYSEVDIINLEMTGLASCYSKFFKLKYIVYFY